MTTPWVAVVPVKALAAAKSRLDAGSDDRRRSLAMAFAVDTVSALRSVPRIRWLVVVCGDPLLEAAVTAPRVEVLPEPPGGGLNEAARAGVAEAVARHPTAGVLVVPADLPSLRAVDVALLLDRAALLPRTVLADREGSGSTVLTGLPGTPPRPRFGPGSLARHLCDGAVPLDPAGLDRASRDVDTDRHLTEVRRLGVGAATDRVLSGD